jgi:hypothetical protein
MSAVSVDLHLMVVHQMPNFLEMIVPLCGESAHTLSTCSVSTSGCPVSWSQNAPSAGKTGSLNQHRDLLLVSEYIK